MSPQPSQWGPPPPQFRFRWEKLRWVVIGLIAAGVVGFLVKSRSERPAAGPNPLEGYQRDVAVLEKEYGEFHGRLLRDPELEHQFRVATELLSQNNYPAAIEVLEKVAHDAAVPIVFHNLGILYAATGDRARSISAFREALARDGDYRPARDTIARMRSFSADEAAPVRQEIEPNGSEVVANLIGVGYPVDGEITVADVDVLKFVTPPAPRDIVEIDVENLDRTLELGIRVHDQELRSDSGRIVSAPAESVRRFLSQPPNTPIYLLVWGARDSIGKYKVTLRPMKAFDALEPNDDIFSAHKLELGNTIDANIMDYEDTDFYSFESPRNGEVSIELKNGSSTLIPAITTFSSDRRNTGFGPDVRTAGASLKHTMQVLEHRTYYVQVWSQAQSAGKYQLTIQ